MLFDTTIWIDHFKGVSTAKSNFLSQVLTDDKKVFITPTIIQEVLQGFSDPNYFHIAEIVLIRQQVLDYDPVGAALAGAKLYANLRRNGVTIRKPNDCLIAAFALHFNIELCHNDRDFDLIASHTGLKIWKE
ncbi:PIN domain-containing protein [Cytophagaceae bacterium SJW1-29]|uniref:Ribonuclease VapC n=1 Tax=Salmonirosea aquatica TaxID=2654236 RepID=A0A7C9BF44_9BACT|nr:PIN domain-containing protein [Cytophagaceae bacterium SJW1-29]